MSTVRDLINATFRLLGIVAEGESCTASQANNALESLNDMIETLNLDNLMVYTISRQTFPLTINQQSYTLGTGGNFNQSRPVRIENASVLLTGASPQIELPIEMMRDQDWQDVVVKSVTSSFPLSMYADGGFPLNTLYFWPIPAQACSVVLYMWNQIQPYAALGDTVTFPNGYRRALRYLLACELAPEYGMEPPATVRQMAETSKDWIRKQNWTPSLATCESMLGSSNFGSVGQKSRGYVVDP